MKRLLLSLSLIVSVTLVAQTNTSSISFDGNDDVIELANLTNQETLLTIVASVKLNSLTGLLDQQTIYVEQGVNGQWEMGYDEPLQQHFFGVKVGNTWYKAFATASAGQWENVAGIYDRNAGKVSIIVDGALIDMNTSVPTTDLNTTSINLNVGGRAGATRSIDGLMDDIHIWNIALSLQEIQDYMNCPPTGNETGLVGYWNFEPHDDDLVEYGAECFDGMDNDFDGQVDLSDFDCQTIIELDWTANGNDGTVLGATYSSDIPLYNCNNVGISELNSNQPKELIKIVNLLGQEVEYTPNTVLIYQYSDGTSEKVFTIED